MKRQNSSKRRNVQTGTHWTLSVLVIGLLSLLPVLAELLEINYTAVLDGPSWVRRHLLLRAEEMPSTGSFWQLVTYAFLHVTPSPEVRQGVLNLPLWIGSYFTLWFFSRDLERRWGPARFMMFYLFGALCAGSASCVLAPGTVLGSSAGAVLAVVAANALELGNHQVGGAFRMRYVALLWLLAYAAYGVTSENGRVATLAQFGGPLGGFLLLRGEPIVRRGKLAWLQRRRQAGALERLRMRRRVDELLDRISKGGLEGLTAREQDFLRRASHEYQRELSGALERPNDSRSSR